MKSTNEDMLDEGDTFLLDTANKTVRMLKMDMMKKEEEIEDKTRITNAVYMKNKLTLIENCVEHAKREFSRTLDDVVAMGTVNDGEKSVTTRRKDSNRSLLTVEGVEVESPLGRLQRVLKTEKDFAAFCVDISRDPRKFDEVCKQLDNISVDYTKRLLFSKRSQHAVSSAGSTESKIPSDSSTSPSKATVP